MTFYSIKNLETHNFVFTYNTNICVVLVLITLVRPHSPEAGSLCPMLDLTQPIFTALSLEKTLAIASTSFSSASAKAVIIIIIIVVMTLTFVRTMLSSPSTTWLTAEKTPLFAQA